LAGKPDLTEVRSSSRHLSLGLISLPLHSLNLMISLSHLVKRKERRRNEEQRRCRKKKKEE